MTSTSSIERAAVKFDSLCREWSREWRAAIDHELAPAGLNQAAWNALVSLSVDGDASTQADMAEKLGLDGATMVRTLDQLEADGLVARAGDPNDRRRKSVSLTPLGARRTGELMREIAILRNAFFAGVRLEEIQACISVLTQICANQRERSTASAAIRRENRRRGQAAE